MATIKYIFGEVFETIGIICTILGIGIAIGVGCAFFVVFFGAIAVILLPFAFLFFLYALLSRKSLITIVQKSDD